MKYIVTLMVLILLTFSAINYGQKDIVSAINETFATATSITLMKSTEEKDYMVSFSDKEIKQFIDMLKEVTDIKVYKSNPQTVGEFKKGFRALFITTTRQGEEKIFTILYSTNEKKIILRKRDVFPEKNDKGFKIAVYEFKAPVALFKLIQKKENELPSFGDYYMSWHFID